MKPKIIFAMIMGTVTTSLISFTVVMVSKGFSNGFFTVWLKSWLISFLVVVPSIILIGPIVQRLVDHLVGLKQNRGSE